MKKHIAIAISQLEGFRKPKVFLEQYETDGDACAFLVINAIADISGSCVVDLGCGTGNLSLACYLGGAKFVLGVDIDKDALFTAKKNRDSLADMGYISDYERRNVQFACFDISSFFPRRRFDVCVMNPPFGIRRRRMDRLFLSKAFEVADVVWTFLSCDSEPFVRKFAEENGFILTHTLKTEIHLRMKLPFHRRKVEHLPVDLYRVERIR